MKEKEISKRIGEQIRLLRLERNLSQEALADEFNLSVSTLSNLERGTTEFTVSRLYLFLNYLKVDVVGFFKKLESGLSEKGVLSEGEESYGSDIQHKKLEEEIRQIRTELERLKNRN